MFRQGARLMLNRAAGVSRSFQTSALVAEEATSAKHATSVFSKKWTEINPPQLDVPVFSPEYLQAEAAVPEVGTPTPSKLNFNFYMPHAIELKDEEVEMVLVPATSGDFGILPGHVPTVAQLRPGVISIHKDGDKDVKKYFVSSGFAFIHANSSAEVCAVEAVPLEQLDHSIVKQSLADYTSKLISAKDDYEKAQAQIGIEVASAMNAALEQK